MKVARCVQFQSSSRPDAPDVGLRSVAELRLSLVLRFQSHGVFGACRYGYGERCEGRGEAYLGP